MDAVAFAVGKNCVLHRIMMVMLLVSGGGKERSCHVQIICSGGVKRIVGGLRPA